MLQKWKKYSTSIYILLVERDKLQLLQLTEQNPKHLEQRHRKFVAYNEKCHWKIVTWNKQCHYKFVAGELRRVLHDAARLDIWRTV